MILDEAASGTIATAAGLPAEHAGPTVAQCDAKLARYRAALDAGADPAVVTGWIAETQAERHQAARQHEQAQLPAAPKGEIAELTEDQIIAIFDELGGMVTALREAAPEDKLEVYRNLGLRLTYHPESQTVRAEVDLAAHRWNSVRVRRATRTLSQPTILVSTTIPLQ